MAMVVVPVADLVMVMMVVVTPMMMAMRGGGLDRHDHR